MVGHGSSDNAASYGVYAFGLLPGWTALRDSISLTVYYGAELDMSVDTAALSQSGRTPDVVEYLRRAREAGAFTVALTNDPESELRGRSPKRCSRSMRGPSTRSRRRRPTSNQVAALGLLAAYAGGAGTAVRRGASERLRSS